MSDYIDGIKATLAWLSVVAHLCRTCDAQLPETWRP